MTSQSIYRIATVLLLLAVVIMPAGCSDDDPVAAANPTVDDALVVHWYALNVTVDDTPVDFVDFFELTAGAVDLHLIIAADATYRTEETDATEQVLHYEEGIAVSSGQTLTLTATSANGVALAVPQVIAEGTWSVEGHTLTFTMVDEGHTIVIVFGDWLS